MVELALHKAILDALAGISAPAADGGADVVVPAYDREPDNAAFPFVVIAGHGMTPADTYDAEGSQHVVYLEARSQYRGKKQILAILGAIRARLHNASLQLEEGEAVLCRVTNALANREPDRITYQGAVTISVTVGH